MESGERAACKQGDIVTSVEGKRWAVYAVPFGRPGESQGRRGQLCEHCQQRKEPAGQL